MEFEEGFWSKNNGEQPEDQGMTGVSTTGHVTMRLITSVHAFNQSRYKWRGGTLP